MRLEHAPIDLRPDPWQRWIAVGQVVSVLVLAAGLYLTYEANQEISRANREQRRLTEQGQITDRFTKAVEQLGQSGPEKVDVRLGAIYALERIMRDSAEDQPAVVDVLAAFVRVHAPAPPKPARPVPRPTADRPAVPPSVDIQATLTVLGRRDITHDGSTRLDLTRSNLSGANLTRANLARVDLRDAYLAGANLNLVNLNSAGLRNAYLAGVSLGGANLDDAFLTNADLTNADLSGVNMNETDLGNAKLVSANLGSANLVSANLTNANLTDASLTDADLSGAYLTNTDLSGAYLGGVKGMNTDSVGCARVDDETVLPDGVALPAVIPPRDREGC
ncbi:pentapeptide repeat-containing protein [Micromonospora sp. WMMD708]|uniref:pentapeptide repeat-containing protein n=1 Tax=Micromonospora sp. WMMD708 TaxID=3403464 RepID=UPI003BF4C03E